MKKLAFLFVGLFVGAGVYAYSVGKFELVIFATLVALVVIYHFIYCFKQNKRNGRKLQQKRRRNQER